MTTTLNTNSYNIGGKEVELFNTSSSTIIIAKCAVINYSNTTQKLVIYSNVKPLIKKLTIPSNTLEPYNVNLAQLKFKDGEVLYAYIDNPNTESIGGLPWITINNDTDTYCTLLLTLVEES